MARSLDIFRQRPAAAARKPSACSGASPYGTRQPHAIVCTAAIRHPARFASVISLLLKWSAIRFN